MMPVEEGLRRPWLADALGAVAAIGVLMAALVGGRGGRGGRGEHSLPYVLGTVALILSTVLIISPFYLLKRFGGVEPGNKYFETTKVVDRGVYGVVRHPQYLGYMLLVSGFALRSQDLWAVALALCAIALFYVQIRREERFLIGQLGADYESYLGVVPRLNLVSGLVRYLRRTRGRS